MNKYLLLGNLTTKDGQRQVLSEILIKASKLMVTAKGCRFYAGTLDIQDSNSVFIIDSWGTKVDYDTSLKVDGVRELIMTAMSILDGQPQKGQKLEIIN